MLSTAYYGLFRIGEITLGPHVIKAKDIHVTRNKKKVMFVLHSSKTHGRDKKPQIIKISSSETISTAHVFCPFRLLLDYFYARKTVAEEQSEQFFVYSNREPVAPHQFGKLLYDLIVFNNLNPELYDSHGFRIGRATDMLSMNFSILEIRKFGRWQSNAVYSYLRT